MKLIRGTYNKPVTAIVAVELPPDVFLSASVIERTKKQMLVELRKELEKQMLTLTVEDITLSLEEE